MPRPMAIQPKCARSARILKFLRNSRIPRLVGLGILDFRALALKFLRNSKIPYYVIASLTGRSHYKEFRITYRDPRVKLGDDRD